MSSKDDGDNYNKVFLDIRTKLLSVEPDVYKLVDTLILQLFKVKKARHKIAFWNCFGDVVFENLKRNINENTIMCVKCGKRILKNSNVQGLCEECARYQPVEEKIIICVDCGKEFKIDSKDNQTDRCPECYKKYRKQVINENAKRYYRNKKDFIQHKSE